MSDPRPPSIFDIIGAALRQTALPKVREAAYGIANAFGSGETNLPPDLIGSGVNILTHATRPDLNAPQVGGTGNPDQAGYVSPASYDYADPWGIRPYGTTSGLPDTSPVYDIPLLGGALKQFKYQGIPGGPSPINDLGPIPFATPETTAAEQTVGALAGKGVSAAGAAGRAVLRAEQTAAKTDFATGEIGGGPLPGEKPGTTYGTPEEVKKVVAVPEGQGVTVSGANPTSSASLGTPLANRLGKGSLASKVLAGGDQTKLPARAASDAAAGAAPTADVSTLPYRATIQKDGTAVVVGPNDAVVATFPKPLRKADPKGYNLAVADAAKRNAAALAETAARDKSLAAVDASNPIRSLSSEQLGALRRVTTDPADRKAIDALLAERAFAIAPEAKIQAAVGQIPPDIHQQIRQALRSEGGDGLTADALRNAPGMDRVLDEALSTAKVDLNIANRKALAEELVNKGLADNIANLQRQAHRVTGDPVADGILSDISHAAGDAKAGAPAIQTFEDTVNAVMRPVLRGEQFGAKPDMAAIRAAVAAKRAATAAETLTPEQQAAADSVRSAPVFAEGQQPLFARAEGSPPVPTVPIRAAEAAAERATQNAQLVAADEAARAARYPGDAVGAPDMAAVREEIASRRAVAAADQLTPEQQAAVDAVQNAPVFKEGQQELLPREGRGSPPPGGNDNLPPTSLVPHPPEPLGDRLKGWLGSVIKSIPDLLQATRGVAGGDVSATASQTFPVLFKQPISYVKGNLAGWLDGFKNLDTFLAEQLKYKQAIEATGINAEVEKGGLLSTIGGNVVGNEGLGASIDSMRSFLPKFENIPVVGGVARKYASALQRSEQVYVGTINAVRTHAYLGAVKFYESKWAYNRAMTLAEKQQLAENIRVLTGRGFTISKNTPDIVVAAAKIGQAAGFSPQLAVARARLIVDTPIAAAKIFWNAAHGAAPSVADVDVIRGAAGLVASTVAMWTVASKAGLPIDLDLDSSRFGLIDLGKPTPEVGAAVAAGEFLGFRTQTYGGHVYVDPGQGVGQDIKLLYRMIGPLFGKLPRDQKGNAWNPWSPKGTESSVMDLIVAYGENKLLPAFGEVAQTASGHAPDLADVTQNPITAFSLPLWVQGGLSASGQTSPGGSLYIGSLSKFTPTDIEKQRLAANVPPTPGMNALSADRQKQFDDSVSAAVRSRITALMQTPKYQAATDAEKQQLIATNTTTVGRDAKRSLAIQIASSGKPEETVPAIAIALTESPSNLQKGDALSQLDKTGRLTPELAKQIDALRHQPDPAKPNYDPSAAELLSAKGLADQWLAAPEFVFGSKAEWDQAAAAAVQLRALRADAARRNVDPTQDPQIVKFYQEQGGPLFAQLYTFAGAKNPNVVGEVRKQIQKNKLWSLIASSMTKLDHPNLP